MKRHLHAAALAAISSLLLFPPLVAAHTNKGRHFYFAGKSYTDSTPKRVKDPVSWIFGRGGPATNDSVAFHLVADFPLMAPRYCGETQRMVWSDLKDRQTSDRQDFQMNTPCSYPTATHLRMWDDLEHSRIAPGHRGSWIVGGIHHEKLGCEGLCPTHKPDRDWDVVRYQAREKAMDEHCSQRKWRFHPGARRRFQGYFNSGSISRISMRHKSQGCRGA